jgi:hypothetical protein
MKGVPPIRKYSVIVGLGLFILFAIFRTSESNKKSTPGGDVHSQSTNVAEQIRPSRSFIRTKKGFRINALGGLGVAFAVSSAEGARRGATEILSNDEMLAQKRELASDMGIRLTNILSNVGSR